MAHTSVVELSSERPAPKVPLSLTEPSPHDSSRATHGHSWPRTFLFLTQFVSAKGLTSQSHATVCRIADTAPGSMERRRHKIFFSRSIFKFVSQIQAGVGWHMPENRTTFLGLGSI